MPIAPRTGRPLRPRAMQGRSAKQNVMPRPTITSQQRGNGAAPLNRQIRRTAPRQLRGTDL